MRAGAIRVIGQETREEVQHPALAGAKVVAGVQKCGQSSRVDALHHLLGDDPVELAVAANVRLEQVCGIRIPDIDIQDLGGVGGVGLVGLFGLDVLGCVRAPDIGRVGAGCDVGLDQVPKAAADDVRGRLGPR